LKVARVTDSLQSRLDQLEVLYSEQDYTIQALNELVAKQDREIARMTLSLEQLQQQLQGLRSELTGDTDSGDQPPPHY
jgi:SlyX protein